MQSDARMKFRTEIANWKFKSAGERIKSEAPNPMTSSPQPAPTKLVLPTEEREKTSLRMLERKQFLVRCENELRVSTYCWRALLHHILATTEKMRIESLDDAHWRLGHAGFKTEDFP